jgi:hypothetical protein
MWLAEVLANHVLDGGRTSLTASKSERYAWQPCQEQGLLSTLRGNPLVGGCDYAGSD